MTTRPLQALSLLALVPALAAQQSTAIDELFARYDRNDSPGAAVLVVHDGAVVHRKGYGMADLEHGVKIGPDTVFDIASVSKQFCGLAIAMLIEQKKLGYHDDVRKHVPWVPAFGGRKITIAHLVHHTSGLRDWPGALRLGGFRFDDVISFEQILRMLRHQRDLNFTPGSRYSYSNTGYNLLAHVVEKRTGQSFAKWTRRNLFRPLGMKSTHFHDDHKRVVARRALAYDKAVFGWRNVANQLTAVGSSSLFTSIDDLARWVLNFETKKVGGKALDRMHTRGTLNDKNRIPYCFGVSKGTHKTLPTVQHTGSWAGFRTILLRFPEQRFAVVILANTALINTRRMGLAIARLYLADQFKEPPKSNNAFESDGWPDANEKEVENPAGHYRSAELQTTYEVVEEKGKLILRHFRNGDVPLRHLGGPRYSGPWWANRVTFVTDAKNNATGFKVSSGRCLDMRFDRVNKLR